MGALAGLNDLVNRLTGGSSGTPESIYWAKNARVAGAAANTTIAGRWTSLWQYGGVPSAGAVPPTAAAAPDSSTPGGLRQTAPGGGRQRWLTGLDGGGLNTGTLMLYDRLLHVSGKSGTSAAAQTVGGALTRRTGGFGNQIWVEIYTLIGTTVTHITANYTNELGQSGRVSASAPMGGTNLREAQRMIPIPLANGDLGVQAVASVTLAGTTGTAGDFGVVVAHPLVLLPIGVVGQGGLRDLIAGLPQLRELDDGCLAWAWLPTTTTAPELLGGVHSVEA